MRLRFVVDRVQVPAKGKMELSCLVFVGLLSILFCEYCITQSLGLSAKEYFDVQEDNLRLVVKNVEKNAAEACALLSTCGGVANCSRQDCSYDVRDVEQYSCLPVFENKYCGANAACKWRNFNFNRSTISGAPTTDMSSNETTMVICAQRALDEVFPNVSNYTNPNQVFFASVDGTARIYPGVNEYPCKDIDARVRPWYLAALKVKKVVMVVIDSGFSMGEPMVVGSDKSQNPLHTAQNLTTALMNTLSDADFVNIMLYNASGATLLAPNPVAVNDSDIYPPSHPEFDPLTSKLMSVEVGAANAGASNLSLAMDAAISNMSPFPSEFVKIAIVLTVGALGDPLSPMWRNLKAAGVKTFVYKFNDPDGGDSSVISDQQQICNIGGSYESFPMNRRHNPLFALQSYYNFLANTHSQMNNSVVYGFEYPDKTQTDSKLFTISLPAYDSHGVLLGVVGLDIRRTDVRNRLGITDTDLEAETNRRRITYTFNAARDLVLDTTTCSNQTSAITSGSGNCGSNTPIPPKGSLCKADDQGRSIAEFSCCGDCAIAEGKGKKLLTILVSSLGGAFLLVLIVCVILVAIFRRPRSCFPGYSSEPESPKYHGPDLPEN